jgi:hypothetical protein
MPKSAFLVSQLVSFPRNTYIENKITTPLRGFVTKYYLSPFGALLLLDPFGVTNYNLSTGGWTMPLANAGASLYWFGPSFIVGSSGTLHLHFA